MLLKVLTAQKIEPELPITQCSKLADILEGYETFANATKTKVLRVIIEA
ncbi:hypothetical protein [Bosea sp. 685]|nr:hypothetical protein [Bosea sp. 685]WNJ93519.1 hypothetical protein RMR04_15030 [Bosea sp. 685]